MALRRLIFSYLAAIPVIALTILSTADASETASKWAKNDRPMTVNAMEYPWSAIGRLNIAGRSHCTGFLAGDRWEGVSTAVYGVGTGGGSTVVLQSSCAE